MSQSVLHPHTALVATPVHHLETEACQQAESKLENIQSYASQYHMDYSKAIQLYTKNVAEACN
jgi:hypothetical protein